MSHPQTNWRAFFTTYRHVRAEEAFENSGRQTLHCCRFMVCCISLFVVLWWRAEMAAMFTEQIVGSGGYMACVVCCKNSLKITIKQCRDYSIRQLHFKSINDYNSSLNKPFAEVTVAVLCRKRNRTAEGSFSSPFLRSPPPPPTPFALPRPSLTSGAVLNNRWTVRTNLRSPSVLFLLLLSAKRRELRV